MNDQFIPITSCNLLLKAAYCQMLRFDFDYTDFYCRYLYGRPVGWVERNRHQETKAGTIGISNKSVPFFAAGSKHSIKLLAFDTLYDPHYFKRSAYHIFHSGTKLIRQVYIRRATIGRVIKICINSRKAELNKDFMDSTALWVLKRWVEKDPPVRMGTFFSMGCIDFCILPRFTPRWVFCAKQLLRGSS